MSQPPINVLVVDDSEVVRMLLVHLLEGDPRTKVAAAVDGGAAALEFVSANLPDVILMDIQMDGMDGFEVTRQIMESRPVPIVMCSGVFDPRAAATLFRAYEAGAVAVVEKPAGIQHPDYARLSKGLLDTVKLMSEVKVVRRWSRLRAAASPPPPPAPSPGATTTISAVGIGASTGGPQAIQTVLAGLPKDFPAPILIVQHISNGFLEGLVEWLGHASPLHVSIAEQGMEACPGHVYLAPDSAHLGLDAYGRIQLMRGSEENGLRPAVDHLFRSLANHCGAGAIGVLLSGMGKDGALELKTMRDRGAHTIAQDRATSAIHGMPSAAIALGAARQILPVEDIAAALCRIVIPNQQGGSHRD